MIDVIERIKTEMDKESLSQYRFGQLLTPPMTAQQVGQILRLKDRPSQELLNRMLHPFGLECSVEIVEKWKMKKKK